jgi:hypothetical protein
MIETRPRRDRKDLRQSAPIDNLAMHDQII